MAKTIGVDPRIDRIAQALHERGIAQRRSAALGRRRDLDAARDKTRGADALKIDVAAVVAAQPQWRERRLQPP